MANQWLRLWHELPNDPKWRTIAKASGRPISEVIATYIHLLVTASQNVTRGHADVTTEDLASALDTEIEHIEAILEAMQGRVLDGTWIKGWENRQPKREEGTNPESRAKSAAERKREERERKRAADMSRTVTQSHDESRKVTTDKDKDKDTEASANADADSAPAGEQQRQPPLRVVTSNPDLSDTDFAKLVAAHYAAVWGLSASPPVTITTAMRIASLRKIEPAAQHPDWWRAYFECCKADDFLSGAKNKREGKPPFRADFLFLLREDQFTRVVDQNRQEAAHA